MNYRCAVCKNKFVTLYDIRIHLLKYHENVRHIFKYMICKIEYDPNEQHVPLRVVRKLISKKKDHLNISSKLVKKMILKDEKENFYIDEKGNKVKKYATYFKKYNFKNGKNLSKKKM